MAGVGDSWGTAEELLHPRDSHGRFRSKWKMSAAAFKRTMAALGSFTPRTFPNDETASLHVQTLAKKNNNAIISRYLLRSKEINADLRSGNADAREVKALEGQMQPLTEDLILSRVVGPEAFGLKPENLSQLEEYTGKLVADKAFGSTNIGTPLASSGPSITMVIAAPKGTRVAVPKAPGSREVIMDREQPLRITKVQPDGKGGFYVMAVAMPKGTAGNIRTKKLGTRARKPTEPTPESTGVPTPEPGLPAPAPAPAPVQTGKPGRPAGPPPEPRNEPHVAEAIGVDSGAPPKEKAPEPTPTAETSTPEPKKVVPPSKSESTPAPETPPAATTPAPSSPPMSTEEASRLIRRTERAQAQANRAKLANARMEGAEEERKKAQAAARREVKLRNEEHAKRAEEERKKIIMGYLAQVGETTLPDPMTQAFIGIKMSAVEKGKLSKRRAGIDFREAAKNQPSASNKRLLNKFADLLVYRQPTKKVTKAEPGAPQAPHIQAGSFKDAGFQRALEGKFLSPQDQKLLDALPESGHSSLSKIENPEEKITAAVKMLQPGDSKDSYVSIADVRKLVGNQLSKEEFDKAAVNLATSGHGDMSPQEHTRPNEALLKANSVRMGGGDKDLIWIDTSREGETETPSTPTPSTPTPKKPGLAEGKTNANRVQVGDRVLVKKNAKGEWVASPTKTGATTITVSKKDAFRRGNRTGVQISGTDENGNEVTVVGGPSIQTYWLADKTAAGKKAAAAKATPAKAATPAASESGPKMSSKPLLGNHWGAGGGEIEFHDDGAIGTGIKQLGEDKKLEVNGEPLANVLGKLATDVVRGKKKSKDLGPQLKKVADKLPEGSKARKIVERMSQEVSFPDRVNASSIPASSPAPIKDLQRALTDIPLVHKSPNHGSNELDTLTELMKAWELGQVTPLGLIDRIRELRNKRHESQEGFFDLKRAVDNALKELDELKKRDRTLLRPPQLREKK